MNCFKKHLRYGNAVKPKVMKLSIDLTGFFRFLVGGGEMKQTEILVIKSKGMVFPGSLPALGAACNAADKIFYTV